jgi:zinc D-Ala-D-Ala dipeptidase
MSKIYLTLLFLLTFNTLHSSSLNTSQQLITVICEDWDSTSATLKCYEKKSGDWHLAKGPFQATLGSKGITWGKGLHEEEREPHIKKEGDLKSTAGIFELGTAFGHTEKKFLDELKIPYFQILPTTEAVDDPNSIHYNRIVNRYEVPEVDWNSSEKMGEISVYLRGAFIHHNYELPLPELGSAIFLHVWSRKGATTGGCTGLSFSNIDDILNWLDQAKRPIIVQLPLHEYIKKTSSWNLPEAAGAL